MAYEKKYSLSFADFQGDSWELELSKDGYTGSVYPLLGTADPVIINDPNQGKGKFTPIKGSKLDMNFFVSPAMKAMFRNDMVNATDRQFRAILNKTVAGGTSQGTLSVDVLDILNSSVDPEATVQIETTGGLENETYCDIELELQLVEVGGANEKLTLVAVPESKPWYSNDAKLLAEVQVMEGDTHEVIMLKVLSANAKFSRIDTAETLPFALRYTETDYDPDLDTNWQIKHKYRKGTTDFNYYYFSSSMQRQWMEINLVVANEVETGDPSITRLAKYEKVDAETKDGIAAELVSQINNKGIFEDIYFPVTDTRKDISFTAVQSTTSFTMTMNDAAADGNVLIRNARNYTDGIPNDTFIEIKRSDGAAYTWTKTDFTGGDSGGDSFSIQVNTGTEVFSFGLVNGYTTDTAATIVDRMINNINKYSSIFSAYVDQIDSNVFYITTDNDTTGWEYKFVTDGNSTLSPTIGTAFEQSSASQIKWVGWVIPGIYKETRTPGYTQVSLTAVDGLGDLKNIDFDIQGVRAFSLRHFQDIITYSLQKTGVNLDLYEAFGLWEANMDGTKSPLSQTFQDTTRLNGRSCYEVLQEIMTTIAGELMQKNGHWEIRPKDRLTESFQYRTYTATGVLKGEVDKTFQTRDVGGKTEPNLLLNANAEIEYAAAYRQVSIKQSFGFVDQLLKFPAFSNIKEYLNDETANVNYPWQFRLNGTIQTSYLSKLQQDNGYLRISSNEGQANKFYFSQKFQIGDIIQGDTKDNQFELSIRYQQDSTSITHAQNFDIELEVTDGTNTVWLNQSDAEGFVWETVQTKMTLPNKERDGDSTFTLKFDYPRAPLSTREAKAVIKIYQPDQYRIYLKSIKIDINAYAQTGSRQNSYHQENVDELTYEVYDKDVNLGDVPSLVNAKQLYKNALYYLNDAGESFLTSEWTSDLATLPDLKPLLDHLRQYYLSEYAKTPDGVAAANVGPPAVLSADIYGPIELRDLIRVRTIDDKIFTLTGGQWNIKRSLVSGEWEQIDLDTSGLTVIDESKSYAESSSGQNSYTTVSGSEEDTTVDLSDYLTADQVNALVLGKTGAFLGSDIVNRQITIYHNLGYEPTYIVLLRSGKQQNPANYEFDTEESNDHIILTLTVPFNSTDRFKYRIL